MWSPSQVIRSILTLGVAQVFTWAATAALTILMPRYLGDAGLGQLAFAIGVTSMLGAVADLGTTTYLARELARDPRRADALVGNTLALRLPLTLAAAGIALTVTVVSGRDEATRLVVYFCCLSMVLDGLSNVLLGTLQGLQRIGALALALGVTKLAFAAVAGALMIGGAGAVGVVLGTILSLGLGIGMNVVALRRLVRLGFSADLDAWRAIVRGGMPFFVWQAALTVYATIDILMLTFLTRDAVVGWYAAAYRIVTIPAFVPAIVMTVVFPALSASSSDAAAFGRLGRRALHGVVVVSVPMALGIMVVADGLIRALGYPASFANSVLPMQILALHIPLAAIDTLIGTVLNASDRQRQWAMTGVAAAVLNPALNMIAIPLTQSALGNGAIGAAVITLATETFMLVAGLRLLPRGIIDTTTTARLARGVAAALVMAAMVWPLRDLPLFVPIGAGVLAYAASCLVLGAVSLGELVDAWHHIVRRGHAAASAPAA